MSPRDFWIPDADEAACREARFIPASKLAVSAERDARRAPINAAI
jgi:hypothetical protein